MDFILRKETKNIKIKSYIIKIKLQVQPHAKIFKDHGNSLVVWFLRLCPYTAGTQV